ITRAVLHAPADVLAAVEAARADLLAAGRVDELETQVREDATAPATGDEQTGAEAAVHVTDVVFETVDAGAIAGNRARSAPRHSIRLILCGLLWGGANAHAFAPPHSCPPRPHGADRTGAACDPNSSPSAIRRSSRPTGGRCSHRRCCGRSSRRSRRSSRRRAPWSPTRAACSSSTRGPAPWGTSSRSRCPARTPR